jgi:hypothetical protein
MVGHTRSRFRAFRGSLHEFVVGQHFELHLHFFKGRPHNGCDGGFFEEAAAGRLFVEFEDLNDRVPQGRCIHVPPMGS